MRKRTAARFLLWIVLAGLLSGCGRFPLLNGQEPTEETTEKPVTEATPEPPVEWKTDEEFVSAVGRALEARWDYSKPYTAKMLSQLSAAEYQDYLRSCVEAEEAQLGSILDYRFRDADLAALAQRYFFALSLQREGAEYARTDSVTEYNRTWALGYNYRVAAVYALTQEFSLQVGEDYASRLAELLSTHYEAAKQVALHEYVEELTASLVYEEDAERSTKKQTCFVGEVVNTTDYDIKSMSIGVSFLDRSGKILFQASDWISDLRSGQSARSTIFAENGLYAGMQYSISIYQ